MADSKITALTELTASDIDDLLAIIDDPAGTPVTKKIKLKNLAQGIMLHRHLAADDTGGQNVNTAQPWFPSNGGVTLEVATYHFRGQLHTQRSAGTTSHTTDILFGGTATLTSIDYIGHAKEGDASTIADGDLFAAHVATATNVKAASTSATENIILTVEGIVVVSGAGTLIPQFKYSAAPGGAPTIKAGTFFTLRKVVATQGAWS